MRDDQVRRYARHILLPDVGGVGQRRLLGATALVRDAGAAGATAVAYLAAAGAGRMVIADERAVRAEDVGALYEAADVGRSRRQAARERIAALNPDVTVVDGGDGLPVEIAPGDEPLLAGARAAARWIREALRRP